MEASVSFRVNTSSIGVLAVKQSETWQQSNSLSRLIQTRWMGKTKFNRLHKLFQVWPLETTKTSHRLTAFKTSIQALACIKRESKPCRSRRVRLEIAFIQIKVRRTRIGVLVYKFFYFFSTIQEHQLVVTSTDDAAWRVTDSVWLSTFTKAV